jgi:hypothetical protein
METVMADIPLVKIQNNETKGPEGPFRFDVIVAVLRELKEKLPSMDAQITGFDGLSPKDKHKSANQLENVLFSAFLTYRQYGTGPFGHGTHSTEVPTDIAKSFGYLALQTSTDPNSARLKQMSDLLTKQQIAEQHLELEPGTVWDRPEARASIKKLQGLWREVKPKIEQLLNDPRVVAESHKAKEPTFGDALENMMRGILPPAYEKKPPAPQKL